VGADHDRNALDAYAVSSINQHAQQLIRRAGFVPEDLHDIKQQLTIHLWQHLDGFDPTRGSFTTFIDRVVRHKAADILEARQAACRDCRLEVGSLQATAATDDGEEVLVEDIAEADAVRIQRGLGHDGFERGIELRIDLARALAALTPAQVDLCRRLLASDWNVSRVAADMGVSRPTLYAAIRQIRSVFAKAGLREHL
jgi:RNA polymerase sigma factor (sigma-70 family)